MKIYAIFKDNELYYASYKQNTPFYSSMAGVKAAIRSITNINNLPYYLQNASDFEKQAYLDKLKKRFKIKIYSLKDEGFVDI